MAARTPATTTTSLLLVFSLLLISCCCAAPVPYRDAGPAESEITWLPGFPAGTKFPSRHFGGHVTVDAAHGRRLYYYLVESEGAHPEQDPLVVWFNGGPGCSSFDGWAYEHGPFKLVVPARERGNETVAAPPRLVVNPFSWAKAANMLYVDAPAGVGFSYSDVAADYDTVDDTRTAEDNLAFLVRWLELYGGRFARSEVYVAGESYAGVYVPTLVEAIHAHNAQVKKEQELLLQEEKGEEASAPAPGAGDGESSKKNKVKTSSRPPGKGNNNNKQKQNGAKTRGGKKILKAINLKGYLLGNPSTDDTVDQNGLIPFMRAMALISETQFQAAETKCNHSYMPPWSDACYDLLVELDSITADINIYNTLEPCWHDPTPVAPASGSASLPSSMHYLGAASDARSGVRVRKRMFGRAWPHRTGLPDGPVASWPRLLAQTKSPTSAADPAAVRPPHPPYTSHRRAVTCTDDLLASSFLNAPGVRDALRAGPVRADTGPWALCTDLLNYTHNTGSMLPRHRDAATRWGLRALIYSGDHDFCVPYTGTQAWVRGLGFPLLHDWQPWYVDDQVAGFSAKYAPDLTFATVLGSGHTVPEYKPAQALAMFQRWLKGDKL